jgi:hypothetical protein
MSASVFCPCFCFLFYSILPYDESSGESFFRPSYHIPEDQILWTGASAGANIRASAGANIKASAGANVRASIGANVGAGAGAAVADGPDILYNT